MFSYLRRWFSTTTGIKCATFFKTPVVLEWSPTLVSLSHLKFVSIYIMEMKHQSQPPSHSSPIFNPSACLIRSRNILIQTYHKTTEYSIQRSAHTCRSLSSLLFTNVLPAATHININLNMAFIHLPGFPFRHCIFQRKKNQRSYLRLKCGFSQKERSDGSF